jgi:hypothetical protein
MECVKLDSSNSPPPVKSKDGVSPVSSRSSSVEGSFARYIGSAAAAAGSGGKKVSSESSSTSSRSSSSSSSSGVSSSRGGEFRSKFVSAEAAAVLSRAPTSAPVSAAVHALLPRKEQKSSHRTIRYFDEADASIT